MLTGTRLLTLVIRRTREILLFTSITRPITPSGPVTGISTYSPFLEPELTNNVLKYLFEKSATILVVIKLYSVSLDIFNKFSY